MNRIAAQDIPLVDLKAQYRAIKPEIDRAVAGVVEAQHFILGPAVKRFEDEFAAYNGVSHCVGLESGTGAVWLMLHAFGIGAGDEVITTPLTFFATVEGILLCGATPVFADVDDRTLNLDPEKVAAAVTARTKAILPVHLYGQPARMDELRAIAEKRRLILLEDAAQSAGSLYRGRKAGSLALAAAVSFYPGKNLGAYGDAGAVLTDDASLADTLRMLRDHGGRTKNHHDIIGLNARMDAVQGAVLSVKLRSLDAWNAARRSHAEAYRQALAGVPGLLFIEELPECRSNYHLFVVRHARRDGLLAALRAEGVQADIHYPVCGHLQPACGAGRRPEGSFPVAERAVREIVSLPMFPELAAEQLGRVAALVRRFCGG
jgi:dTDP-4-amino-4,6-dideoxygalactose transaminase